MSVHDERNPSVVKMFDHLERIAKARANLLQLLNEMIEQLDLEGKNRNLSPEVREMAAEYLRMIRGEDQR